MNSLYTSMFKLSAISLIFLRDILRRQHSIPLMYVLCNPHFSASLSCEIPCNVRKCLTFAAKTFAISIVCSQIVNHSIYIKINNWAKQQTISINRCWQIGTKAACKKKQKKAGERKKVLDL